MSCRETSDSAHSRTVTKIAVALVLLTFWLASWELTSGFSNWTFEARRFDQVAAGMMRTPKVLIQNAGSGHRTWPDAAAKVYLVDFIYTRCESVCQVLGSEYQRMQRALLEDAGPGSAGVRLMSLSFDMRDRPEDLQAYGKRYGADPAIWTIATAKPGDTERMLRAFKVVVIPDGMGGYVHNGAIHLVCPGGDIIGIFAYQQWEDALQAARDSAAGRGARCEA